MLDETEDRSLWRCTMHGIYNVRQSSLSRSIMSAREPSGAMVVPSDVPC
jgi:hypothetical protein